MLRSRTARSGSTVVEAACVYPAVFLIVCGVIIFGIGVFRYQQVTHIAREASRWAAVHGAQYATENKVAAATPEDVYWNAIVPQAAGMKMGDLTYSVTWNASNSPTSSATVTDPTTGLQKLVSVTNTVSVTVTYSWNSGVFGTIPVSSTSVTPMSY